MSSVRGQALQLCLQALERGIIPEERREEVLALVESFPPDQSHPQLLVDQGIPTQEQLAQLIALLGTVKEGHDAPPPVQAKTLRYSDVHAEPAHEAATRPGGLPRPLGEDYELRELIGEGAMGEVYRAWQHSPQREVAIKLIKPWGALEEDADRRFFVEAQAAARLDHLNIVRVHQVPVHEGEYSLVMELVEGGPLSRVIHKGRRALRRSLGLLERVARAGRPPLQARRRPHRRLLPWRHPL